MNELDKIIDQMIADGRSEEEIGFIIQEYQSNNTVEEESPIEEAPEAVQEPLEQGVEGPTEEAYVTPEDEEQTALFKAEQERKRNFEETGFYLPEYATQEQITAVQNQKHNERQKYAAQAIASVTGVPEDLVSPMANFAATTIDLIGGIAKAADAATFATMETIGNAFDPEFVDSPEKRKALMNAIKNQSGSGAFDEASGAFDPTMKRYDHGISESIAKGDYEAAASQTADQVMGAIPSVLATMTGGGGIMGLNAGLIGIGASTFGSKFEEDLEANPEESTAALLGASLAGASYEMASEYVTHRLLAGAGLVLQKSGKEAAQGFLKKASESILGGFLTEGGSEAAAELATELTDTLLYEGKKEVDPNILPRLLDTFLIGGIVGSGVSTIGKLNGPQKAYVKERLKDPVVQKEDQADVDRINDLEKAKKTAKTENEVTIIQDAIDEHKDALQDRNQKNSDIVEDLSKQEVNDLVDSKQKIAQAQAVLNDFNASPSAKDAAFEVIRSHEEKARQAYAKPVAQKELETKVTEKNQKHYDRISKIEDQLEKLEEQKAAKEAAEQPNPQFTKDYNRKKKQLNKLKTELEGTIKKNNKRAAELRPDYKGNKVKQVQETLTEAEKTLPTRADVAIAEQTADADLVSIIKEGGSTYATEIANKALRNKNQGRLGSFKAAFRQQLANMEGAPKLTPKQVNEAIDQYFTDKIESFDPTAGTAFSTHLGVAGRRVEGQWIPSKRTKQLVRDIMAERRVIKKPRDKRKLTEEEQSEIDYFTDLYNAGVLNPHDMKREGFYRQANGIWTKAATPFFQKSTEDKSVSDEISEIEDVHEPSEVSSKSRNAVTQLTQSTPRDIQGMKEGIVEAFNDPKTPPITDGRKFRRAMQKAVGKPIQQRLNKLFTKNPKNFIFNNTESIYSALPSYALQGKAFEGFFANGNPKPQDWSDYFSTPKRIRTLKKALGDNMIDQYLDEALEEAEGSVAEFRITDPIRYKNIGKIDGQFLNVLGDKLNEVWPDMELITDKKLAREAYNSTPSATPFNNISGFTMLYKGKQVVYVSDFASQDTRLHEFAHVWLKSMKQVNPELWNKGAELIKQTRYWEYVQNHEVYSKYPEERMLEEAMAEGIGQRGTELFNTKQEAKTWDSWVTKFWNQIGDIFGFKVKPDMNLDQFMELATADILRGRQQVPGQTEFGKRDPKTGEFIFEAKIDPVINDLKNKLANTDPSHPAYEIWQRKLAKLEAEAQPITPAKAKAHQENAKAISGEIIKGNRELTTILPVDVFESLKQNILDTSSLMADKLREQGIGLPETSGKSQKKSYPNTEKAVADVMQVVTESLLAFPQSIRSDAASLLFPVVHERPRGGSGLATRSAAIKEAVERIGDDVLINALPTDTALQAMEAEAQADPSHAYQAKEFAKKFFFKDLALVKGTESINIEGDISGNRVDVEAKREVLSNFLKRVVKVINEGNFEPGTANKIQSWLNAEQGRAARKSAPLSGRSINKISFEGKKRAKPSTDEHVLSASDFIKKAFEVADQKGVDIDAEIDYLMDNYVQVDLSFLDDKALDGAFKDYMPDAFGKVRNVFGNSKVDENIWIPDSFMRYFNDRVFLNPFNIVYKGHTIADHLGLDPALKSEFTRVAEGLGPDGANLEYKVMQGDYTQIPQGVEASIRGGRKAKVSTIAKVLANPQKYAGTWGKSKIDPETRRILDAAKSDFKNRADELSEVELGTLLNKLQDLIQNGKESQTAKLNRINNQKATVAKGIDAMLTDKSGLEGDVSVNKAANLAREKGKLKNKLAQIFKQDLGETMGNLLAPVSNNDFYGLMMDMMPKGKARNESRNFLKSQLFYPLETANVTYLKTKRQLLDSWSNLKQTHLGKNADKVLNESTDIDVEGIKITKGQAVRIYNHLKDPRLHNQMIKGGVDSQVMQDVIDLIKADESLLQFADAAPGVYRSASQFVGSKLEAQGLKGFPSHRIDVNNLTGDQANILGQIFPEGIPTEAPYTPFTAEGDVAPDIEKLLEGGKQDFYTVMSGRLKERVGGGQYKVHGIDLNSDIVSYAGAKGPLRSASFLGFSKNLSGVLTQENMRKMKAHFGQEYVNSLQDATARILSGTNRKVGTSKAEQTAMNWINNSVAGIMFYNFRSGTLQLLSTSNFMLEDTNYLQSLGKIRGDKKTRKEISELIRTSPWFRDRAEGGAELEFDEIFEQAEPQTWLGKFRQKALKRGYDITKFGDREAIARGGAPFILSKMNKYMEQGATREVAKQNALRDFIAIAEESQQSSRPERLGRQQTSTLGRLVLAFANTPQQYNRKMAKAFKDLTAKGSTTEQKKVAARKILYFGATQNLLFNSLQKGLFMALDLDDDEDYDKVGSVFNSILDTIMRGSGIIGAALSTLKNIGIAVAQKGTDAQNDALRTFINTSPAIGSKYSHLKKALGDKVYKNSDGAVDVPAEAIRIGSGINFLFNLPLDRAIYIAEQFNDLFAEDLSWGQKLLRQLGWSRYSLEAPAGEAR